MKKFLFGLAIFAFGITLQAQNISFEKKVHDYGTIEYKSDGTYEFVFTNTGDKPLIITTCKGSCGCTVPKWPKEPIQPGESKAIKVKYATNRVGPFTKTVTVNSNSIDQPKVTLRIKGKVNPESKEVTMPLKKNPNNIFAPTSSGAN